MAYYARYRGAGASLLGDGHGIKTKAEADRLIDGLLGRHRSRAISIASQPVEATMNDSLADEIGTTKTGQDK